MFIKKLIEEVAQHASVAFADNTDFMNGRE